MKNNLLNKLFFLIATFVLQVSNAQVVTINSLSELKSYSSQDNVTAVMTPGTYVINSTLTGSGKLLPDPIMFEFTGSNCTYDFTDVVFEFDTEILNDYGSVEVVELRIYGDNNVLKNLTMVDIGSDAPKFRARTMHLDGLNNRIEGFHITVRGAYPYGYGDLFGKGGGSVIGHRKHSGILVRGDGNHIKDCTMIHRSYGHGIFIQGGKNVLIEGVYMEGDALRTTDNVLAEEGSGSAADNVNFMTVWGYRVPAGYMFSKQEDGIRTYASAGLYSNDKTGAETVSTTENVTVRNCVVKHMRSGYSFAFGSGDIRVEDSQSLECEAGFGVISGGVIKNCSADAKYGMVYANAYNSNKNITAEITILNSEGGYGPHHIAYVGGSNNNMTFKSDGSEAIAGKSIQLGGPKKSMRMLIGANASQTRHNSVSNTIKNHTSFPIVLDAGSATYNGETYTWSATDNDIETCGDSQVTDLGSNNTVSVVNCTNVNLALNGVASQSSTAYGGLPEYANDGNTDGDFKNGSVTHTAHADAVKWWQVDLGNDYLIDQIKVYNRTQQDYGDRLNNYTVEVINAAGVVTYTNTYVEAPDPSNSISIGGVVGSIVKVSKSSDLGLTLAEVEVFGENKILSVSNTAKFDEIQIYPNPVSDVFTIVDSENTVLEIYDTVGKLVLKEVLLKENVSINISHLVSGVYILIVNKNGVKTTKKIIKK